VCKCEAPPRLSLGRHAIALHEQRLSALSLLVVSDDYVDVGSRGFRWGAVGEVLGCRWGYACGRATGCVMCESRHVKRSQSVCSLYVRANDRERAHVNEGLALASWHLGGFGFSSSRSVLLFGLRMTINKNASCYSERQYVQYGLLSPNSFSHSRADILSFNIKAKVPLFPDYCSADCPLCGLR